MNNLEGRLNNIAAEWMVQNAKGNKTTCKILLDHFKWLIGNSK